MHKVEKRLDRKVFLYCDIIFLCFFSLHISYEKGTHFNNNFEYETSKNKGTNEYLQLDIKFICQENCYFTLPREKEC